MARKILAWIVLVLGGLFLLAGIVGMIVIWVYNTPLTQKAIDQLQSIDTQLTQAQITLASSEKELQRALRIVNAAQTALDKLKQQNNNADSLLDTIQSTLDDKLLPELKTTRGQIDSARTALEQLQSLLAGVESFIPGVDLSLPDKLLADLIASANSLNAEIINVEALAQQASLFVSDSSYLLGGDLTETRDSLQGFLASIQEYQKKLTGWREQVNYLLEGAPKWIDQASIALTVFLFWFAISQFGLLLHGLSLLRGGDPLAALRPRKIEVHTDGVAAHDTSGDKLA